MKTMKKSWKETIVKVVQPPSNEFSNCMWAIIPLIWLIILIGVCDINTISAPETIVSDTSTSVTSASDVTTITSNTSTAKSSHTVTTSISKESTVSSTSAPQESTTESEEVVSTVITTAFADSYIEPINNNITEAYVEVVYNEPQPEPEPVPTEPEESTTIEVTEPYIEPQTELYTEQCSEYVSETVNENTTISSNRPCIYDCTLSDDLQQYIYDTCNNYGVDYCFIMAIIKTESGFNTSASNGSCYGLMQLNTYYNSGTASNLGVSLYDPYGNVTVGIYHMADLLSRYSYTDALICYNYGEYGARGYLGGSTYYTDIVMSRYYEYLG